MKTPVALFVFNRPETTRRLFDAIAAAEPPRLLVVADGPRGHRVGDVEACARVREIVREVRWPCEVSTLFAATNLGCDARIVSGLDWVFSMVEEAIVLEDDCLPDPSFFRFCDEMLQRYHGDARVASIGGTQLVPEAVKGEASYLFSQLGGNWGWATWREEWQRFDRTMEHWPALKLDGMLGELFDDKATIRFWTRIFDEAHASGGSCPWDYRWVYTHLRNNALTVLPRVNLVQNIGFGEGATHTGHVDERWTPAASTMQFPLRHPESFIAMRCVDRQFQSLYAVPLIERVRRKIRGLRSSLRTEDRPRESSAGSAS